MKHWNFVFIIIINCSLLHRCIKSVKPIWMDIIHTSRIKKLSKTWQIIAFLCNCVVTVIRLCWTWSDWTNDFIYSIEFKTCQISGSGNLGVIFENNPNGFTVFWKKDLVSEPIWFCYYLCCHLKRQHLWNHPNSKKGGVLKTDSVML